MAALAACAADDASEGQEAPEQTEVSADEGHLAAADGSTANSASTSIDFKKVFNFARNSTLGVSCPSGGGDCNRCVQDVEGQFAAFSRGSVAHTAIWRVPTKTNRGEVIVNWPRVGGFVVPYSHIQGLARIESTNLVGFWHNKFPGTSSPLDSQGSWYATSFGEEVPRGLTLSWVPTGPRGGWLLQPPAPTRHFYYPYGPKGHPGGIQAIGPYVLVAMDESGPGTRVDILDVSNPYTLSWSPPHGVSSIPLGSKFGIHRVASVGVAKLLGGGYLVMVQEKAGFNTASEPREFWYDLLRVPSLADPSNAERVGRVRLNKTWQGPNGFTADFGAETLSLVTDCNTGRNYAITANGLEYTAPTFQGDQVNVQGTPLVNTWALHRIDGWQQVTPVAFSVYPDVSPEDPDGSPNCAARGGTTAFADESNRLVLARHEKMPGYQGLGPWSWDEFKVAQ